MLKSYRQDYPRPQLVRDGWVNFNGIWDFAFDDRNVGESERWYDSFPKQTEINVPFTYETKLSGIGDESLHEIVWYNRRIEVDGEKLSDGRVLLHFEGSDFITHVWINGQYAGSHRGGYARFSLDITKLAKAGENTVTVKVEDYADEQQPRGKQRWISSSYGCWYVQTTGIWKTVWMEYVPADAIMALKLTPDIVNSEIRIECDVEGCCGPELMLEASVTFDDIFVGSVSVPVMNNHVSTGMSVYSTAVTEWGVMKWDTRHPSLYDLRLRLVRAGKTEDEVLSYFGMREIRTENGKVLLNGEPLYQRLILDQGYWPDSHLTPPSEKALIEDIDKLQQLGYNGLRKHQKIEDERFLYWCDVKGMLVWSEMAAAYRYSDCAVQEFTTEWMEIVRQNYSHPCIITWTPFNESWGVPKIETERPQQHFTEAIYHLTKAFDPMRPVVVNDGWEHTVSDIITLHDYEESGRVLLERYGEHKEEILTKQQHHSRSKSAFANGYAYHGQPILISEYGGIAFNNGESGWGYGNKVQTEEDFLRRFDEITTAIKELPYVCGFCYTQVTDVQQEINGLMDPERHIKVSPERICEINERHVGALHSYMY